MSARKKPPSWTNRSADAPSATTKAASQPAASAAATGERRASPTVPARGSHWRTRFDHVYSRNPARFALNALQETSMPTSGSCATRTTTVATSTGPANAANASGAVRPRRQDGAGDEQARARLDHDRGAGREPGRGCEPELRVDDRREQQRPGDQEQRAGGEAAAVRDSDRLDSGPSLNVARYAGSA